MMSANSSANVFAIIKALLVCDDELVNVFMFATNKSYGRVWLMLIGRSITLILIW
jgi:hypothetical protein